MEGKSIKKLTSRSLFIGLLSWMCAGFIFVFCWNLGLLGINQTTFTDSLMSAVHQIPLIFVCSIFLNTTTLKFFFDCK